MAEDVEQPEEQGLPAHRDVTAWLAHLEPAAGSTPQDASDRELLDSVEVLHRTQAALHLERARMLALLWGRRRRSSVDDEAVVREVAMISGVSLTAAERMLTTSLALDQGFGASTAKLLDGTLPWSHVEVLVEGAKQVDPEFVERFEAERSA